jgi:hypothetical protein
LKKLPLGQQDFAKIIESKNTLYVDKTKYIHKLITSSDYYFLSRPRRFGKSLLISTLKELFEGNKELFKSLWIYDKIDWEKHPVIHISFNTVDFKGKGLKFALEDELKGIASSFEITLVETNFSSQFRELIKKLSVKGKVVVLIDEYDKPIIDYIEDIPQAEANREILKSFYSILKDSDKYLRFLFITGVSKFSKVSIFSDLNHLNDITIDKSYNALAGITQQELEENFEDHIEQLQRELQDIYPNVLQTIKDEYLGYSWDGENNVYNPFVLLNLFSKMQFGDYWYQSGTPSFLMKMIKQERYTIFDLENKTVFLSTFDKYEISNISLLSLLFQTGYLTIKKYDFKRNAITLDFPNHEVARSFSIHLIAELNGGKTDKTNSILYELTIAIEENRIEAFMEILKSLFKGIDYPLADSKEKYFHSIFYLVLKMLGFNIETEIMTIDGRIDAVLQTSSTIYVIEFKTGNTKKAMEQLFEKQYHQKYILDKRSIILLGIDFDATQKCISAYQMETVKPTTN